MNDLEMARDLRRGANTLRMSGWTNSGDMQGDNGEYCMAGALLSVRGGDFVAALETEAKAISPIRDLVTALGFKRVYRRTGCLGVDKGSVVDFNDDDDRTLDEVLDRLESTALALEVRAFASEASFNDPLNVPVSVNVAEPVGV